MCEEEIKKGDIAIYIESRTPVYQSFKDDQLGDFFGSKQVGIKYSKHWTHADHGEEDCPNCNDRTAWRASHVHQGLEYYKCSNCGHGASYG